MILHSYNSYGLDHSPIPYVKSTSKFMLINLMAILLGEYALGKTAYDWKLRYFIMI